MPTDRSPSASEPLYLPFVASETEQDFIDTDLYDVPDRWVDESDTCTAERFVTDEPTLSRDDRPPAVLPRRRDWMGPALLVLGSVALVVAVVATGWTLVTP